MSEHPDHAAVRPLKMHLRLVPCAGGPLRVLSLRPDCRVGFSTNRFHETWHVITDEPGAHVLARLMWGLAFQKQPRTVVAVWGSHLRPTPFDADPSDPIVLCHSDLGPPDADALRALRDHLRRPASPACTVRLHTFGLQPAREERDRARETGGRWYARTEQDDRAYAREQMRRESGCLVYRAPAPVLRERALYLSTMRGDPWGNYFYLCDHDRRAFPPDGEVQVFTGYERNVSAAVVARREVLAETEQRPPADPQALRETVWARRERVLSRARRRDLRTGS